MGNSASFDDAKKKARKGGRTYRPTERDVAEVKVRLEGALVSQGTLDLSGNDPEGGLECLSLEAMEYLRAQLESGDVRIRSLLLPWNVIGSFGAESLVASLSHQTHLHTLDVSWNGLGGEGALDFAQGLKDGNLSLTSLNLSGNNICDEGAIAIATALKSNRKLTSLVLRHNAIKRTGSVALGSILKFNATLISLDLGENSIGCKGAAAIADGLVENVSLERLSLNSNGISCDGAEALAEALKKNSALKYISLVRNSIDRRGARSLSLAMHKNTTLTSVGLRGNFGVTDDVLAGVEAALERNIAKPMGLLTSTSGVSSCT